MQPSVDFHTHVLPGIDDGSRSVSMTEAMLESEADQGIQTVIATPHFYADRNKVSHLLEKRERAFGEVRKLGAEKDGLPCVIQAAEVFFFPGIGTADMTAQLCAGKSRVLFLEMPFDQWSGDEYDEIRKLCLRRGFEVVLVHLERFLPFQKDQEVLRQVLKLPVTLQINAGCLLKFMSRRRAKKILSFGKPVVLGSD